VPSHHTVGNDFSQADLVVPSLDEITMGVIDGL
jgi:hypothetical protein